MSGKKLYTEEQKAKVLSIINSQKKQNRDWNEIADFVNSQNILPRKFDGRSLFKTTWFWNKKMNGTTSAKKPITTAKRSYRRKPQIEVLPIANVNSDANVIVLVVKSSNIRSVLEQLQ